MNIFWFFLLLFGIIIVANPDIIAYLIGFLFIIIGANMVLMQFIFKKSNKESIKFWSFEIFRNKPKK
ncbi:MAG: hypothetical protein ACD_49C00009G0012 [uncultured bacterium (gcode 4)]|uniref:Uncharacterized protein n=1 Tax=uncultured bacterium (gcode 4) TaxID=1234023 RepID=K2AYG7_9BACT|nr:MAG: hypothetical protein ACD_49C00009G0012 [uncultured bacterium (gcode 4)]